jgi:DNA-binding CsgD family transcriptional regulator
MPTGAAPRLPAIILKASGETVRRGDDARLRLTPQEMQIVTLAAHGLSNPEIAERL